MDANLIAEYQNYLAATLPPKEIVENTIARQNETYSTRAFYSQVLCSDHEDTYLPIYSSNYLYYSNGTKLPTPV